jgi:peptidoglycan hydrolase CwlO-like protein
MSDGQITFNTALDNSQLEKDLKDAGKKVDELEKKLEKSTGERTAIEQEMERGQKAIEATSAKLDELKAKLESLGSTSPADASAYFEAQQQAQAITAQVEATKAQLDSQLDSQVKLERKWQETDSSVKRYNDELTAAKSRQKALGAEYARTYQQGSVAFAGSMGAMEKRFNAFTSKITKRMKKLFVFSFIFGALAALKGYLTSTIGENDRFAASLENLKAVMRGFAAPAVAMLANVLTNIVNVIASMLITLGRMVDSIFHTNIVQSIEQAQAAARSAWNAADATDEQANATKRLSKAQKEATRWLAAFDELNQQQADSNEGIADDLGDLAGGGDGAARPDWDALDVGKISEKLSAIMIILGAALMAVGAVLAFSGINIPLGITLMAIGALMVYTAASENWDKLPQEVRDAINAALIITGIVLIVIGAVLAFSGANIPLGIGLMAAGAILLATAAAINWDSLSGEMQETITKLLVIVGGALLVIGAILALTGANVPLGIGLMALGAIALGTAAVLNWDTIKENLDYVMPLIEGAVKAAKLVIGAILAFSGGDIDRGIGLLAEAADTMGKAISATWDAMPDEVKGVIATVELAVGGAFLAIGAILCFSGANIPLGIGLLALGAVAMGHAIIENWEYMSDEIQSTIVTIEGIVAPALLAIGAALTFSGANIPLGLALMAGGALALAHLATLDWSTMPDGVQDTVTKILGIIGGALIVLGIILCVTGVGIPLGVALIIAGAGSLISAVAVNWDGIKEKANEVWQGLKSWFQQNVAQIFTPQFWADKWSAITKGLGNPLQKAGDSIHGFAVDLCKNIGGALSMLGQSWSFSIPSFRVPALATGAVIPPNSEFLAVLGDQKRGRNVEAPEDLIRQIVREEAGSELASSLVTAMLQVMPMMQQQGGDVELALYIDSEELARCANKGNASLVRRGAANPSVVFR